MHTPLIVAAHGTRDAEGEAQSRRLAELVGEKLAPTPVTAGFVELNEPGIDAAVDAALTGQGEAPRAVVVPLMLGTGGHVRSDIPDDIEAGKENHADAEVTYTGYLGHDPRLLRVLADRIEAARGEWDRLDTTVVLVGRGAKVPEANADHARLARMMYEMCEVAQVIPAFSQVTRPGLPEALNQAYAAGARKFVVGANLLFHGRLRTWMHEQVSAWTSGKDDVEVRITDVIGPCDELADVVVDRYRAGAEEEVSPQGSPAYLAGLLLQDRDVLVVGAGRVADRRVPRLLEAGATVTVVSPSMSVRMAKLARAGEVVAHKEPFSAAHLDERHPWYVLAATNDPTVNDAIAQACEERRIFCVRADDARHGTSWTPATARVGTLTVGVLGDRSPELSVRVREAVLRELLG